MNIKPILGATAAFLLWQAAVKDSTEDPKRAFVNAIWAASESVAQRTGWPRDLIITAATHESGAFLPKGMSLLGRKYNNLFGYKANAAWLRAKKPVVMLWTWEHLKGKNVKVKAPFKVYPNWKASIEDYVALIQRWSRYQPAEDAALRGDAKGYFAALQKGGYATDPNYAKRLGDVHEVIETYLV